jgi:hypothetical protein
MPQLTYPALAEEQAAEPLERAEEHGAEDDRPVGTAFGEEFDSCHADQAGGAT